jgi:hypothetical protein
MAAEEQRKKMLGRDEWAVKQDVAQVGEWEVVAPPKRATVKETQEDTKTKAGTTHDQAPELQDDDEGDDDLNNFKLREKELPIDPVLDSGEEVAFKKRKIGGDSTFKSRKKKPLRKKD